ARRKSCPPHGRVHRLDCERRLDCRPVHSHPAVSQVGLAPMIVSPAFTAFLTAVAWFCVFVVAHIAGWRTGHGNARWLLISYASSVLGMLIGVIGLMAGSDIVTAVGAVLLALMTNACLFVLYVPAVYVVLTSLSVQTLV